MKILRHRPFFGSIALTATCFSGLLAQTPANQGLPLPKPASEVIKNADDSTTTISHPSSGRTEIRTVDSHGNLVGTVTKYSTSDGTQTTIVDAGNQHVVTQTDRNGVVRHMEKLDSDKGTKTTFDYDEKGQLQKAWFFKTKANGGWEPDDIYEAPTSPDGQYGQQYNRDTKKFEKIGWAGKKDELDKIAADIKGFREQFDQQKPDDLDAVRMEAAKNPMELAEPPAATPTPTVGNLSGPLPPPSDPFKAREAEQQETEKQLDPCLKGTWRSESIEVILLHERGGGDGIVITIGEDHSVTIDYSAMTPMRGGNANNVWKGVASGHMWATNGRAGVTSIEKAEAYLITNGRRNPQGNYKDLGPAKITKYQCDETTLVTETVTHRITYKRQTE
jgi:hypothetical protein